MLTADVPVDYWLSQSKLVTTSMESILSIFLVMFYKDGAFSSDEVN